MWMHIFVYISMYTLDIASEVTVKRCLSQVNTKLR